MNQCTCPQAIAASEQLKTRLDPQLRLFPRVAGTGIDDHPVSYPIITIKDDD